MHSIIIVDDSRLFQKVMTQILSPYFQISGIGASGLDAIELYKVHQPELVLLDITMPYCSGKESLAEIMKIDPKANVVMVSALEDIQTVEECLALGAKAFIPKEQITYDMKNSAQLAEVLTAVIESHFKWDVA